MRKTLAERFIEKTQGMRPTATFEDATVRAYYIESATAEGHRNLYCVK